MRVHQKSATLTLLAMVTLSIPTGAASGMLRLHPIDGGGSAVAVSPGQTDYFLQSLHECFVENRGQTNDLVRYYSKGNPAVAFRDDGVMFLLRQDVGRVRLDDWGLAATTDRELQHIQEAGGMESLTYMIRFDGANRVAPAGRIQLPFLSSFFVGSDPSRWRTGVPCFGEVVYEGLYDGIDLVFRPKEGGAKYEFIIAPWTNPEVIAIRYEGVDGLSMNMGILNIRTPFGEIHDTLPYSFQHDGREILCEFTLRDSLSYGFECKGRRAGTGIVIDPLIYSTFLGGSSSETIHSIKVDALGHAYVTGHTDSLDFPATLGSFDTSLNVDWSTMDSFVAKLDPTGSFLIYATYLGGGGEDRAESIALSPSGETYVTGYTCSEDFPTTTGSFDRVRNGTWDGFVAKLSRGGDALLYSTYIGGNDEDKAWSLAVDDGGNSYVAGYTLSADFPTTLGAFDTTLNGQDAFVIKLNATGSSAIYSTLLGGNGMEYGKGIAVDSSGAAFVTGWTGSADYPVSAGVFDSSYNGGRDMFITKLAPAGDSLIHSTFLGGSNNEMAAGIALDAFGYAYVAGQTQSPDFPITPGSYDNTHAGTWDIVVAKVNPTGTGLAYSTFVGGSFTDTAFAISITPSSEAYVAGRTYSADFPTTADAFDSTKAGDATTDDGVLLVLDASGGVLKYSTFVGGTMPDWATTVAIDSLEDAYVAGMTLSSDFVTTPGAYDRSLTGSSDGFIMKLRIPAPPDFIDLVVTPFDIRHVPPGQIVNGTVVSINATVHNAGGRNATNVLVRFHDGLPAPLNQIDSDQVIPNVPYLFGTGFASVTWSAEPEGIHDICVVVDPDDTITESDETNNQACTRIEVSPPLPDLSVRPADIGFTPSSPLTEFAVARVNATVRNLGGAASGATVARFHDGLPPSPQIGGDQGVPPIPINDEAKVSVVWSATPPGMHVICVVADPDNIIAEIDETNNMACAPVEVLSLPDLVPHGLNVTPSSPILEGTMSRINVTVSNEGDMPAGAFDALLFDDKNGNRNPDAGEQIGINASSGIASHSQSGFVFDWNATPAGTHSICAYADPPPGSVTESNESNNVVCIDGLVQPGPILRPDYIPVSPLPLPPIRVGMSSKISLSAQVLNQGNGTATSDATVAFYEPSSPPFSMSVLTPLTPAATSSRFAATWTSPATPGTYTVSVDVDYYDNVTEWDEANNVYTWTIEVVSGSITSLVIGSPNYTSTFTYVRSTTPLDFSVIDQSGTGIRYTNYSIDGNPWVNYTATGTFYLTGEGEHNIEWFSVDHAGNVENVSSIVLRVDDIPPATSYSVGDPKHQAAQLFITSTTAINLTSVDGGVTPVGLDMIEYRIDGPSWNTYSSNFTLTGSDGPHTVYYRSRDLLWNGEVEKSLTLFLDNTPPATTISPATGEFNLTTMFTLTATDGGSGVGFTRYSIDGGTLTDYSVGFTLQEGNHNISYHSIDKLDNTELEKSLTVTIQRPPLPNTSPTVTLTSPTGGEEFVRGSTHTITWTMHDDEDANANLTVYVNYTSAGTTVSMVTAVNGIESFLWTLPDIEASDIVVNVTVIDSGGLRGWDESGPFTIKAPPPPPGVEANYKPLVALVFAIILAVVGLWSSRRRPWKGGEDRMAVMKAFAIFSLPFVLAEITTGVVSLLAGELRIPPTIGIGIAIDSAIFALGAGVAALNALGPKRLREPF